MDDRCRDINENAEFRPSIQGMLLKITLFRINAQHTDGVSNANPIAKAISVRNHSRELQFCLEWSLSMAPYYRYAYFSLARLT